MYGIKLEFLLKERVNVNVMIEDENEDYDEIIPKTFDHRNMRKIKSYSDAHSDDRSKARSDNRSKPLPTIARRLVPTIALRIA